MPNEITINWTTVDNIQQYEVVVDDGEKQIINYTNYSMPCNYDNEHGIKFQTAPRRCGRTVTPLTIVIKGKQRGFFEYAIFVLLAIP